MWEWLLLFGLIIALIAVNFRRVRTIPGMLHIRSAANKNLTGVKMRYSPHMRRNWMYVLMATHGIMDVLLAFSVVPIFFDWPWDFVGGIGLLVFGMVVTVGFGNFALWYDDLHWMTRTLKADIMEPIPWNGNHLVYKRTVGKEAVREQQEDMELLGSAGIPETKFVTKDAEYWSARESAPDKWWGKPPADGYFVVWRKARDQTQLSLGQSGYQFGIDGEIHPWMLGGGDAEAFAEFLPPRYRRLVDGLDPDLRAWIYANYKDPKPAWWSGVLIIEEPDVQTGKREKGETSISMLDLMDLRAKVANYRRAEDRIAEDKQRMQQRLTKGG